MHIAQNMTQLESKMVDYDNAENQQACAQVRDEVKQLKSKKVKHQAQTAMSCTGLIVSAICLSLTVAFPPLGAAATLCALITFGISSVVGCTSLSFAAMGMYKDYREQQSISQYIKDKSAELERMNARQTDAEPLPMFRKHHVDTSKNSDNKRQEDGRDSTDPLGHKPGQG